MTLVLLGTILGFFAGFAYVIHTRKVRPGKVLAATLLGLLTAGLWKIIREQARRKGY